MSTASTWLCSGECRAVSWRSSCALVYLWRPPSSTVPPSDVITSKTSVTIRRLRHFICVKHVQPPTEIHRYASVCVVVTLSLDSPGVSVTLSECHFLSWLFLCECKFCRVFWGSYVPSIGSLYVSVTSYLGSPECASMCPLAVTW